MVVVGGVIKIIKQGLEKIAFLLFKLRIEQGIKQLQH
jgi:hypothetical protein